MEYISEVLIFLLLVVTVLHYIFRCKRYIHHSHWSYLVNGFSFSSKEFYDLLVQELKKNELSGIRFENVCLKEGNFFSTKRLYLRIHWKEYHFDICAAPFGNGFFFSWWLNYNFNILEIVINIVPFIGGWLVRNLFSTTYYKRDTASMFMKLIHKSILDILDDLTVKKGIHLIKEEDRRPILNNIFDR